jgi:hypothetical protein
LVTGIFRMTHIVHVYSIYYISVHRIAGSCRVEATPELSNSHCTSLLSLPQGPSELWPSQTFHFIKINCKNTGFGEEHRTVSCCLTAAPRFLTHRLFFLLSNKSEASLHICQAWKSLFVVGTSWYWFVRHWAELKTGSRIYRYESGLLVSLSFCSA